MADKKSWFDDDHDDEADQKVDTAPKKGGLTRPPAPDAPLSGDDNAQLVELMDRVEPLVMSINTLMNQYAAGLEHRPPLERLAQLETVMNTLSNMAKTTPAYRFRYQNVLGIYSTYKAKWEKLKKDIESGKVKRFAAPKKNRAA